MKYLNRILTVLSSIFIVSTLIWSAYSLYAAPHGNVIKNEVVAKPKSKITKPETYYTLHLKLELPDYSQSSSGFFIRFNILHSDKYIVKYCKPSSNPEYSFKLPKNSYVAEIYSPINQDASIYDTEPPLVFNLASDKYELQKCPKVINADPNSLLDTLDFIHDIKSHTNADDYNKLTEKWRLAIEQDVQLPKKYQNQILNRLK